MIYGKSNLHVYMVTSPDKGLNILNNVHLAADGSSVGADNKCVLAVSPLDERIRKQFLIPDEKGNLGEGITISTESIKGILKNVPTDKTFNGLLEQTVVQSVKDGEALISTVDERGRPRYMRVSVNKRPYIDYKNILRRALEGESLKIKICLNRKRLAALLSVMEKACPDEGGESPVFIEVNGGTGEILLRARNDLTGQVAVGVMNQYSMDKDVWLERSAWEKGFTKKKKKKKKEIYCMRRLSECHHRKLHPKFKYGCEKGDRECAERNSK